MVATIFKQQHQIKAHETDVSQHLTMSMLVNIIMVVSEAQTEALQVGAKYLSKRGLGWVVTQYQMTVNRLPRTGETVTVATRATAYNRYFAFREFWVSDKDGNECVHVESIWVVMDRESRKMISIPEDVIAPFEAEMVKKLPRLTRPTRVADDDQIMAKPYRVRYFDIDGNGHVNNAHYFDWLLDALSVNFLTRHRLVEMSIRFENEVQYQQTVTSEAVLVTEPKSSIITKHRIVLEDGAVATEAECHWEPLPDNA